MKRLFVIGGIGAGKSSVSAILAEQGIERIDLDQIGHEVLTFDEVKAKLSLAFGADVLDKKGNVQRSLLAQRAFSRQEQTQRLEAITRPSIEACFAQRLAFLEEKGSSAVVVEFSTFKDRIFDKGIVGERDTIIAVVASVEKRVARSVAKGWTEQDVRCRIAQQITDEDRRHVSDVVFTNEGSFNELRNTVLDWWNDFNKACLLR